MTVQEICQRLARWTSSKSLSQMTIEDRLVILDCVNIGIYNWFAAAPERYRETTISHVIPAPETGTATITEGSNELVGAVLDQTHLGASIRIGSALNMNEIVSVSDTPLVLNAHRESGTVSYTIYFDTIMITDYYVNRIISNPRILDTGVELFRDSSMRFIGAERRGSCVSDSNSFGNPRRYTFDNTGISLNDEARIMIRLDPIPSSEMTVVFDASIDAPTYDLTDIEGAVNLPVPDQYVLPHLLPLALGELAISPIWEGTDANTTIQKSNVIISKISDDLKLNNGAPRNRVRTRPGY